MTDAAKSAIMHRLAGEGYSGSYGILLYLVAVMGTDPKALGPQSEEELTRWGGHFEGLRAALHCLVMHEQEFEPDLAALIVSAHIKDAVDDLDRHGGTGTGG
jgi:hypothetical protein